MNFMLTIFRSKSVTQKVGKQFFDGLSEEEKLIYNDLKGPSWSPEKKIKRLI